MRHLIMRFLLLYPTLLACLVACRAPGQSDIPAHDAPARVDTPQGGSRKAVIPHVVDARPCGRLVHITGDSALLPLLVEDRDHLFAIEDHAKDGVSYDLVPRLCRGGSEVGASTTCLAFSNGLVMSVFGSIEDLPQCIEMREGGGLHIELDANGVVQSFVRLQ